MPPRLLIDGYNLLHASNVFASSDGPPTLERTRKAFLDFLIETLSTRERARTTVVFDATQAAPNLPHRLSVSGMEVLFSRHGQDADQLLEDLLESERAPRETLVVSSDHRVQRAARQRGAKSIDSERWYREAMSRRQIAEVEKSDIKPEPSTWENSAELAKWMSEFGDVAQADLNIESKPLPKLPPVAKQESAKPEKPSRRDRAIKKPKPASDDKPNFGNPFPPGYGEDLL